MFPEQHPTASSPSNAARPRRALPATAATICALLALPTVAAAQDPAAGSIVQQVSEGGQTMTMRMRKVPLRGPHFEIREQRSGGGYVTALPPIGERSFLGTVDERPGAVASGIVTADGHFRGAIYFDRGTTWFVKDGAAEKVEGTAAPTFRWPTTPTLSPGIAGTRTYGFDVAVDADNPFVKLFAGSTLGTLDAIEYSMSNLRAIYIHDGLLQPRLARVVLRKDSAADPYRSDADNGDRLTTAREHWNAAQTDADRDTVIMAPGDAGGGLAYSPGLGKPYGYAVSGAYDGVFDDSGRHEVGHNFDIRDDQGDALPDDDDGGPEGETIMAGNEYSRFSGPELQQMISRRNAQAAVLEPPARFTAAPVAPYAALDLVPDAPAGGTTVDVLANDHDANGDALRLVSVDTRTAAGGTARVRDGKIAYVPPAGRGADTFRYRIADTCGQTATGVVFLNASSGDAMPASPHVPLGEPGPAPDCPTTPGTTTPGGTTASTGTTTPGSATGPTAPGAVPGGTSASGSAVLQPAKLEVSRATISRTRRRLTVTAPITARASGTVRVAFRAAGKTTRFDATIDARRRRVTIDRRIAAAQARAGSGILTLTYRGDADTQPQTVRLRAASRAAGLRAGRPTIAAGRLRASGRISSRARGVVRVQILFEPTTGATQTLRFTARISKGRYRLSAALPASVRSAIATRRGVLHSYTLFTGDLGRNIRGELASYEVLGKR